jgi:hypothetical protein
MRIWAPNGDNGRVAAVALQLNERLLTPYAARKRSVRFPSMLASASHVNEGQLSGSAHSVLNAQGGRVAAIARFMNKRRLTPSERP